MQEQGRSKNGPTDRPEQEGLPSCFAAVRSVARWFGVNLPEMEKTLQQFRATDAGGGKGLPRRLTRVMLSRAEVGVGRWCEPLRDVALNALHQRIRFASGRPLFGTTAQFAAEVTTSLLRLYETVAPKLCTEGASRRKALRVLVDDVLLPTVFLELVKVQQPGRGTEFSTEACWYLPAMEKGQRVKPFVRVIGHWLHTAGFRTADDIGKGWGADRERRKVAGWLKAEHVPAPEEISRLVEKFAPEVRAIEDPDVWKGRLGLAAAVQNMGSEMDSFFHSEKPPASVRLITALQEIGREGVVVDDGRVLASQGTFFAARLLQRRLRREGKWDAQVTAQVEQEGGHFPRGASDQEIEHFRRKTLRGLNPGNRFLDYIQGEIQAGRLRGSQSPPEGAGLADHIFEIGVAEVNRILATKGAGG